MQGAKEALRGEFNALMELVAGDGMARSLRAPLSIMLGRISDEGAVLVLRGMAELGARVTSTLHALEAAVHADAVEPPAAHVQDEHVQDAGTAATHALGVAYISGVPVVLSEEQAGRVGATGWLPLPVAV